MQELRGFDLRYLITTIVLDAGGASTETIRCRLEAAGVDLGPDPRRRLYGAIRSEIYKRRLRRAGPGRYVIDELPESTRYRIQAHTRLVRARLQRPAA